MNDIEDVLKQRQINKNGWEEVIFFFVVNLVICFHCYKITVIKVKKEKQGPGILGGHVT